MRMSLWYGKRWVYNFKSLLHVHTLIHLKKLSLKQIWAARSIASSNFVLFVAVALVQYYRDIILANNMDFTEVIKFFNGTVQQILNYIIFYHYVHSMFSHLIIEMAERHNAKAMLAIARGLVLQIQTLIQNK